VLERDRDLEAFPSAIGKDGYPSTVGPVSRRRDFGKRSVVMTAIVKVLPEPPVGLQFAPARFLEEDRMKKDIRMYPSHEHHYPNRRIPRIVEE
jgi:hypothetical protein